jgi:hypothetical protein
MVEDARVTQTSTEQTPPDESDDTSSTHSSANPPPAATTDTSTADPTETSQGPDPDQAETLRASGSTSGPPR